MKPSIGRIVHYKLAEHDDATIKHNGLKAGDVLPAVIVRVWGDECLNLRVICDGPGDAWKTSVTLGDQPGQWSWPIITQIKATPDMGNPPLA